ncbi:hypothetical protein [Stenotrophomonas sp.]|jgi:hypothetical protein|nr:hypothetical protein [Stenotrophomonas sp.]
MKKLKITCGKVTIEAKEVPNWLLVALVAGASSFARARGWI